MASVTKVWVRRPNSSPVRIQIPSSVSSPAFTGTPSQGSGARDTPRGVDVELTADFLIDDLREAILKKYPQSLGKHHDSADLSIQIPTRRNNSDDSDGSTVEGQRILRPDESVIKILTEEYPDGQKSDDAWLIVTSGGRDNYTRWWLQTGGLSTEFAPFRAAMSPNQYISSAGGSFASGDAHQEYFPYMPIHTQGSPSGEYPPRSRASGSSMMSSGQYPRTQGRPPLRPARTTTHEGFPQRTYVNTSTSSMVVEPASASESEVNLHQHGRASPDSNVMTNMRYPPNIRPGSSISGRNTPPSEYPKSLRQYVAQTGMKPPAPTAGPFQMHLPQQPPLATIPQKAQSPLGGPPTHPQQSRLSQGSTAVRPIISTATTSSPITASDKPQIQAKGATSPKSPPSGTSSNNSQGNSTSPVTRRKSNTISGQGIPVISKPRTPSPVVERTESPLPPRVNPLVKPKEKDTVAPKNSTIGVIPPINVLIVEDNFINAQILEVFFRKRKLKYATAVNGKEAVEKWRQGGWHLVLMDIQLPVMSGIEATKEIRRLERVNHIGVFSEETTDKPSPEDELGDLPFPSPVIIVALTASSRESDRNEALAAGCNDFLTKPVGAPWLERKAIEWGCMQALIWTSFERRRRRREGSENNVVGGGNEESVFEGKKEEGLGEGSGSPEKPTVARGDSGESVVTQASTSTDEGQH